MAVDKEGMAYIDVACCGCATAGVVAGCFFIAMMCTACAFARKCNIDARVQSEKQEQKCDASSGPRSRSGHDGFETLDFDCDCSVLNHGELAALRDSAGASDHEYDLLGIQGDQMREQPKHEVRTSSQAHADACMDEAWAPHSPNFLGAIKDASVWGPGDALLLVTRDHQASLQELLARRRCSKLRSPVGSSRWIQPIAQPSSSRPGLRGEIERLNRFDRKCGHVVLQS